VNQVPRRNYIKFLELIGVYLEPPQPARTEVMFRLTGPLEYAALIPRGTEVATVRTSTEPSINFATEEDLEIKVPSVIQALVSKDEFAYRDYMPALKNPTIRVPIFEDPPKPGNGFYIGLAGDMAAHTLLMDIDCEIEGIGVDPRNPPLAWEYYDGSLRAWRATLLEEDGTGGLNRSGRVLLHIPSTSRPRELDRRRATWLRCRVTENKPGQKGYTASPRILQLGVQSIGGAVMASHSELVTEEILGRSDGTPGQSFTLSAHPLLPRRDGETLEVETEQPGIFERWQEVADFSSSTSTDPHFTCDSVTGQIRLGPAVRLPSNRERQHGRIPPIGRTIRFSQYRIGGGVIGNVGKHTLTQLKSSIPYVKWVTNPQPAMGGTEAETLDAAMIRGPQVLRSSPRAVTAEDYERLALEGCPDLARARCIYAKEQDDGMAGSVRLVLVPLITTTDGPVPAEQLALSDSARTAVQDYLDVRRMITVRLVLTAPTYVPVSVRLEVFAKPKANKTTLRQDVEQALYRFIHPTVGGPSGEGWPFERPLFISDIYGLVQTVANVEHLGAVHLVQITADQIPLAQNALFCSAPHVVTIK
jgi:predicted phage baseplate assembly protein